MRSEKRGASPTSFPRRREPRGVGRGRHFRRSREGGNPEGRRRHFRQSREGLGCAAADGNPVVPAKAGTQRGAGGTSVSPAKVSDALRRTAIPSFPRRREPRGARGEGGTSVVPRRREPRGARGADGNPVVPAKVSDGPQGRVRVASGGGKTGLSNPIAADRCGSLSRRRENRDDGT